MQMQLHVLQDQWMYLAFGGGLGLVLFWALSFLMMWRPRAKEGEKPGESPQGWITGQTFIPWVLIITLAGTFLYAVIYTVTKIIYPPNW